MTAPGMYRGQICLTKRLTDLTQHPKRLEDRAFDRLNLRRFNSGEASSKPATAAASAPEEVPAILADDHRDWVELRQRRAHARRDVGVGHDLTEPYLEELNLEGVHRDAKRK